MKKKPLFRFVLRLAQITVDGGKPTCFHCDKELPPETRCELSGSSLQMFCPFCECTTVVKVQK